MIHNYIVKNGKPTDKEMRVLTKYRPIKHYTIMGTQEEYYFEFDTSEAECTEMCNELNEMSRNNKWYVTNKKK